MALSNLGVACDLQGNTAGAEAAWRAALAARPGHAEAHFNLATLLLRRGETAEAAQHLHLADALSEGRPQLRSQVRMARNATRSHAPLPPGDRVAPLLLEALELRRRGMDDAAIDRLHRALLLAPGHGPAAWQAGELCVWTGRLAEAQRYLATALPWMATHWKPKAQPSQKRFDRTAARAALFAVLDATEQAGLAPFLNGGTLLGCVREGDFISFDSDIDIAVSPGTSPEAVIDAVDSHPDLTFLYHDVWRGMVLRVRFQHSTGIGGDVFLYQQDEDGLWCGVQRGVLALRWRDSPFGLRPLPFLGRTVLAPDPAERYLEENYGRWQTPDPDHVPGFSAPNLIDPESDVSLCTLYLSLMNAMAEGHAGQTRRYLREALHRFPANPLLTRVHAILEAQGA